MHTLLVLFFWRTLTNIGNESMFEAVIGEKINLSSAQALSSLAHSINWLQTKQSFSYTEAWRRTHRRQET